MWVSKWRWDLMNERLEAIEKQQRSDARKVELLEGSLNVYVPDGPTYVPPYYHQPPAKHISLREAVNKLAEHLGVSFKVIDATPAVIVVEKRSKKAN
jgi:hypothetical protein